jgi:hypothetical protein
MEHSSKPGRLYFGCGSIIHRTVRKLNKIANGGAIPAPIRSCLSRSLHPTDYIHRGGAMRTNRGANEGMAEEWIERLAQDIKQKDHEAAEDYGRSQHYAGIISDLGNGFFLALAQCLTDNVEALRRGLQGDVTAAETAIQSVSADEIKITRARFPWVDARVIHNHDTITLDYARGPGVAGDPNIDRTTRTFAFKVAQDDTLYTEEAFSATPQQYKRPEELARRITETLFAA